MRRMRGVAAASAIAAALLLSGCTLGPFPQWPFSANASPTPTAGVPVPDAAGLFTRGVSDSSCISISAGSAASATGVGPDLSTTVDCQLEHAFELTERYDLPAGWVDPTGSRAEIAEQLDALLSSDGPHAPAFQSASTRRCDQAAGESAGLDEPINGVSAARSALRPFGEIYPIASVPLASQIVAKVASPSLICSVAYADIADESSLRFIPTGQGRVIDSFLTPRFPVTSRVCWAYDEALNYDSVSCDSPHWLEPFAEFDAAAVFGSAFVADWSAALTRGQSPSQAQQDGADLACYRAFSDLVPGDAGPSITAWDVGDWTAASVDEYSMVCAFSDQDAMDYDVIGSYFGATAPQRVLVGGDGSDGTAA